MRVAHLWMTLCTVEKGGIMITSPAHYERAQSNFPDPNSSGNVCLRNVVFSFYFIFFHSCRNLEVTALRRGTGRELQLRCW